MILPLQFDRNKTMLGDFRYEGIARLRPGIALAQANADIQRLIPTVWGSFPAPPGFSINLAGHDPQLEKAIDLAKEGLKSYKGIPERPKYPKKVWPQPAKR